jgi:DHA1 family bicyclomycin/chloramphenicol resistance-like MFS transporter
MTSPPRKTALILGLMACVGPLAIDMYLPAMPVIGTALQVSAPEVQVTITAYFFAFGLAQLIYGPWADEAGRKPPLYIGLAIFILGSALAAAAPGIGWLVAARFVQGLGGAAVMVIPRAIIRDLHTGPEATRLMASIMLVIAISPMLAPLAGSGLIALAGWRAIFGLLSVAAVLSLSLAAFALPETLPPERRAKVNRRVLFATALRLLTDRTFLTLTLLGGFGMASFFVFLASAAFVYTGSFGLSPSGFSLAFAVNAIGFFSASQAAASLGLRFGSERVVAWATTGFAAMTVALLLVATAGGAGLVVTVAGLFLANACLGLVIPTAMVMALDAHGDAAGMASSLGGTLQMLAGGAMIAVSGPFFDGTVVPMLAAIAVCGVAALILSRVPRPAVA